MSIPALVEVQSRPAQDAPASLVWLHEAAALLVKEAGMGNHEG